MTQAPPAANPLFSIIDDQAPGHGKDRPTVAWDGRVIPADCSANRALRTVRPTTAGTAGGLTAPSADPLSGGPRTDSSRASRPRCDHTQRNADDSTEGATSLPIVRGQTAAHSGERAGAIVATSISA